MNRSLITLIGAGLLLAGCTSTTPGTASEPAPEVVPPATQAVAHNEAPGPDPWPGNFLVRYGQTELTLGPSTYCHTSGTESVCVDGYDMDPPSVGNPDELFVFVPEVTFTDLVVSQISTEEGCTGSIEAVTEDLGGGWWKVRPSGPASKYRASVSASGTNVGDMIADVVWDTPPGEALPPPTAQVTVVSEHDGRPNSDGVEMFVENLAQPPKDVAIMITVAAAGGESLSFELDDVTTSCAPIGAISALGSLDQGNQAAALGDFPFTITVSLTLDGVLHTATGIYPDDAINPGGPYLPLVFAPPLQ